MKRRIVAVLKSAVILLCFWAISRKVDWHETGEVLAGADQRFLAAAVLCVLAEPVVLSLKWRMLMAAKGIRPPLPGLLKIVLISNFLSLIMPTSLGTDALRIWMLRRRGHAVTHTAGSLLADRVLGITVLVLMSLAGLLVGWSGFPDRRVCVTVVVICAALLAVIAAVLSPVPYHVYLRCKSAVAGRIEGNRSGGAGRAARMSSVLARLVREAERVYLSFRSFRKLPGLMLRALDLNAVIQLLRVVQIHFLFLATGAPVSILQELAFVPIIILLTILPVSYFGLGIKEGAFIYLFSSAGIAASRCVGVSLLTYVVIFLGFIPGMVLFLKDRTGLGDLSRARAGDAGEEDRQQ
jgi:uncharacterized protein (TIRG00374 family)